MLAQRPISAIATHGLIVLLLIASFPELTCCCNISWGPIGLLDPADSCQNKVGVTHTCRCCREKTAKANPLTSAEHSESVECAVEQRPCTFHLVSPKPMAVGDSLSALIALPMISEQPLLSIESEIQNAAAQTSNVGGDFLTAGARCARLQSWRI